MIQKIALTSLIALFVAMPVFAESFPVDEYMLENKTYDNAATYTNMGIYEGSVDAEAEYNDCPQNSYCDTTGIHQCPAGYPHSVTGSSASTQCYTACTVENANIAHASAVTGNKYNGGTDTCSATACENGWHVNSVDSSNILNLNSIIGTDEGMGYVFIGNDGTIGNSGGGSIETYDGINSNNSWVVDFGDKGIITGRALCSTHVGGTNAWQGTADQITKIDSLTPEFGVGKSCYCQIDSYTSFGGSRQSLSGPWVFESEREDATYCANHCAGRCAFYLLMSGDPDFLDFREALLGSVSGSALTTCVANSIIINWSNVDPVNAGNQNESTVTYGGDINTPFKAEIIPGKTFVGWRFVKPNSGEEEGSSGY